MNRLLYGRLGVCRGKDLEVHWVVSQAECQRFSAVPREEYQNFKCLVPESYIFTFHDKPSVSLNVTSIL